MKLSLEEFKTKYDALSEEDKAKMISLEEVKGVMNGVTLKDVHDSVLYHQKLIADSLFQIEAGLHYAQEGFKLIENTNGKEKDKKV